MIELRLLARASLAEDGQPVGGTASHRHALALFARLTIADRGVPRDRLLALLWPERDSDRARNSLNVLVHGVRKALGADVLLSRGSELRLNADRVTSDVARFEAAIRAAEWERAATEYAGPFLEGLHLPESLEFEEWSRAERERLAALYRRALESLAVEAEATGDLRTAIETWRRLLAEDPSNALVAVRLMEVLEAVGERGAALDLAVVHESLLRNEFGAEPDPEVVALAARLREAPNGVPHVTTSAVRERAAAENPRARVVPVRRSRWRYAAAAAVGIVAVLVGAFFARPGPPASDVRRVVATPFENRTGDPALDDIGRIAADWLTQGMAQTGLVEVLPAPELSAALARDAGAGWRIEGSYFREGDSIGFDVRILNASTGELVGGVDRVFAAADEPVAGIEILRQRTIGALATLVDDRLAPWARTASLPPSLSTYRQFEEGMQAFLAHEFTTAVDHFLEAAAADSTFHTALVWAALADRNTREVARADSILAVLENRKDRLPPWDHAMLEFLAADQAGDRRAAYASLSRVVERTPSSDWNYLLGATALGMNRPHAALTHLLAVDVDEGWLRDWESYWPTLATTYHRLEQYPEEWETIEEWRRRYPESSPFFRVAEMRSLAALGRVAELEERMEASRVALGQMWEIAASALVEELQAHGLHDRARAAMEPAIERTRASLADAPEDRRVHLLLHQLLYQTRRYDESYDELQRALAGLDLDTLHPWDLGYAGRLAARQGDRELAARVDARLKEIDASGDFVGLRALPVVNRSLIAALEGRRQRAVELLRTAIYARDMPLGDQHPFFWDGDFAPLEGYPPYEDLVRPR